MFLNKYLSHVIVIFIVNDHSLKCSHFSSSRFVSSVHIQEVKAVLMLMIQYMLQDCSLVRQYCYIPKHKRCRCKTPC